ncbi:MAG TPA: DUF6249 domain-containing protein [Acidobacteriaceae bacterium]|nr:DUF6249 domain-containing protein [Acidobacteriaceae bacterium]
MEPGSWSYGVNAEKVGRWEGIMDGMWNPGTMVFVFLAVGAVALFSMISIASWSGARQKEREAYYKNDMLKKLAEAQGPGANSALELLREEDRIVTTRTKWGLQISGLVTAAVGLGLMVFLAVLLGPNGVWLCGLIPLLVGVALYVSARFVKPGE